MGHMGRRGSRLAPAPGGAAAPPYPLVSGCDGEAGAVAAAIGNGIF